MTQPLIARGRLRVQCRVEFELVPVARQRQPRVDKRARDPDVVAGLRRIAPPDGAFYIYADVSHLTADSLGLARDILHKAGVAVTPGLDFDARRGGGTFRFSYARATADIVEGLARLRAYGAGR